MPSTLEANVTVNVSLSTFKTVGAANFVSDETVPSATKVNLAADFAIVSIPASEAKFSNDNSNEYSAPTL